MKLFPFLLCVLSIFISFPVQAQTGSIAGQVKDDAGHPLPGVNVFIAGTPYGSASDLEGRYQIREIPSGQYVVTASAVGFERSEQQVDIESGVVADVDFLLKEVTLESGEVIVTASRRAQLSASAPVSVSVLTPREIEVRNILTLDDALRYIPGVQMADNQVNIRGSSGYSFNVGSRVLLLVDGVPLLGPETGGVPFEALPMSQIERIEVVKGPGSALYGGGALGGIIHMITKDFPDKPETALRLFAGAYEPVRHETWKRTWNDAGQFRPLAGMTVTHARNFGNTGGMWVNLSYRADAGYLQLSGERDFQGHAKVGWRPSPSVRLDVLGGATIRSVERFYYWNGADDVLTPGRIDLLGSGISGANDYLSRQISILPTLTHVISPTFFYTLRSRLFRILVHPYDEEGNLREDTERTIGYRFGGDAQVNWTPSPESYLVAGLSGDANAAESKFFTGEDGRLARGQPEGAAYLQWEQGIFDKLNLTGGLRFDAYQIDTTEVATKLSPKLNAVLTLSNNLTLRASYGQGFRVPGVAERFTNNQDFLPILPNLSLRPEESTGYELGVRSLITYPKLGGLQLDGALFWNDYRRLVEPVFRVVRNASGMTQTGFQFVNLTRARIRGFETSAEFSSPIARTTGRVGYTFIDARDLTEDRPLVFRSRHLFKAALDLHITPALNVGTDFRYASRPERFDSDFSRFVPDAELMVPTRVLDFRGSYRWKSIEVGLIINNALEYYYVERPAILAPTRHYILQLLANF